jgi:mannose/fructose/N-acetylgalactosamine-specific phosphotransferase system component IIC
MNPLVRSAIGELVRWAITAACISIAGREVLNAAQTAALSESVTAGLIVAGGLVGTVGWQVLSDRKLLRHPPPPPPPPPPPKKKKGS